MLKVSLVGMDKLKNDLVKKTKKIQFAAKYALDYTAKRVVEEETKVITSVFDRPNPKTQTAVKTFKKARTDDLSVVVGIYDGLRFNKSADTSMGSRGKGAIPPAKYLLSQIVGGRRAPKRFELALQRADLMPSGMAAVFAKRSNAMDQYGNITQGKIVQILSYFAAFPEGQGYKANMSDKRKQNMMKGKLKGMKWGMVYFRGGRHTGLPDGIWERHYPNGQSEKSFIRPILIYVRSANYKIRFPFQEIAKRVADETFPKAFDQAWRNEISNYGKP